MATPLIFVRNAGQDPTLAQYLAHGPGYSMRLSSGSVELSLSKGGKAPQRDGKDSDLASAGSAHLSMIFAGANPDVTLETADLLPGTESYFTGPNEKNWHTGLPTYGRLHYRDIYPGIDLTFHGGRAVGDAGSKATEREDSQLEYDIELQPHADAGQFGIELGQAERAEIDKDGNLQLSVGGSPLRFLKPVAWQGSDRKPVEVSYRLKAAKDGAPAVLSFETGKYDHGQPLVIDPVLSYATYLNLYSETAMTVDGSGNVYVAGQDPSNSIYALDVLKFSPAGVLLYTGVLQSSSGYGFFGSIAVDAAGDAYVAGAAGTGWPTTATAYQQSNGYSQTNANYTNAYLMELNPAGSAIAYASYLGGNNSPDYYSTDGAVGVALDSGGKAYITGIARSRNFPTTPGALATQFPVNGSDYTSFAAKFDTTLSGANSLIYSTLLGGDNLEYAIAVDSTGSAYLAGSAGTGYDSTLAPTPGAVTYNGLQSASEYGAYVSKLNPAGTALVYSAYVGPGYSTGIAVDGSGDAYVTGQVGAEDFPTTSGAYQTSYPGGFVVELNPTGSAEIYSTFLGGPSGVQNDGLTSPQTIVIVPGCSSACPSYIAGTVSSPTDFPQINSIQTVSGSTQNSGFLVALNGTGSTATLSTYMGGITSYTQTPPTDFYYSLPETSASIGIDASGNIYYAADLSTPDYPVTTAVGATPSYYPFLAKISPAAAANLIAVPSSTINLGQTITGTSSAMYGTAQTVTIRNAGSAPASISSIATSSAIFSQTNTCGSTIAAGGQCTLSLSFTPTVDGTVNGSVSIASNVSGSPLTINVTGSGTDGSFLQVSGTSLNFGTQTVGTSSAFQTVTVKNTGNQATSTAGIAITGLPLGYNTLNNCPASLGAGQSCAFGIQFAPYQVGLVSGGFYIYNPNAGYTGYVTVSGTGIISGNTGALTLSSTGLNFNTLAVGLVSPVQYVSITNTGMIPVTMNSYSAALTSSSGTATDFTISPYNCGAPPAVIQAQSTCALSVTFTPSVAATETATLSIPNSSGTTATLTLSGTGTADTQTLVFMPANFVFPDQAVGTTGTNQYFYAANTGNYPVSVDRVFASGDFTLESAGCAGTTISPAPAPGLPGGYCYVVVAFSPTATGSRTGSLTFVDTAGGTQTLSLTGNGITPTGSLVVDPAALVFPAQAVGTTSATQSFNLSNSGNSPVTVNSIGVTGDYSFTEGYVYPCGYSLPCVLPAGSANTLAGNISFTPTSTTNPRTGTLTINSSAGVQTISLTGTGETATTAIALTPAIGSTLSLGNQQNGTVGNPAYVYLRNVGTTPVTIPSPPTITGNYTQQSYYYYYGNECGYNITTLQPGTSCTSYVQFSPTTTGTQTGVLTFTDSAGTQKLNLTGTGTASTPTTYFSQPALVFPQTPVGDVASYYSPYFGYGENFYYTGSTSLTIASASVTAGGSSYNIPLFGDNCTGAVISSGGSCSFNVNFVPTAAGYVTGTVTLTDTSNVKYTLPLSGYSPTISDAGYLSPDSLVFTSQAVGTVASGQLIYLNNTGTTDMTVSTVGGTNVGPGSEFPFQYDDCSGVVVSALGGSCYFYVQFAPSTTGSRTGQISIPVTYGDGTTGTFTANLTGTGGAATGKAILTPVSSQYPDTTIGTSFGSSYYQAFSIYNLGTLPLTVGQVTGVNTVIGTTRSGDYTVSDSCSGVTVAAGATCAVSVYFSPLAGPTGARTGSITFPVLYSGASTVTPFTATFTGNAVVAGKTLIVTPTNAQLGSWIVGVTSSSTTITLNNTGNVPLTLSKPSIAAPFGLQNNCTSTLAANSSCTIYVAFRPTATGNVTGTLMIPSNAPGGTQTVTIYGTGLAASQQLVFSQSSIAFGNQVVSTTSNGVTLTLINQSQAAVLVKTITLGGTNKTDFAVASDGCTGVTLYAQYTCAVVLDFAPASTSTGYRTATITETDSGTGGPRSVSLTGSGINPTATVGFYPSPLLFGSQNIGTTSPSQTLSVTNTGSASLRVSTVTSTGSEFAITSNACNGATLAVGTDCLVSVTFTPATGGSHSGTLSIADSASGSPQTVTLTGQVPQATLSPSSLTFPSQNVGTSSNAMTSTLSNTGTGALSIASIAVGGTGAANFSSTNNCGSVVYAGGTCTISVVFAPTAGGSLTGNITVTDNAGLVAGSTQALSLSGTGVAVAAKPTFTPAAGTYTSTQSVTIADATSGATIYYTTNGSTPTTASAVYAGPITVSASETIEAIATASGYSQSATATAAYTITLPAATPTFTPAAGTYTSTQSVTIADGTSGATIYYTTNGTTPTTASAVYTGPITVSTSETIEAIAVASGYSQSATATAAYTITPPAATPTFTPAAGTYASTQSVTIADATSGATVYYTTNGSTPTTSSALYAGPITVSASETIEAIATASGYSQSATATAAYTITPPAATPTFTPAGGTYTSFQSVTIADATPGATIYYTTNGSSPTTSSSVYSGAITVSTSETINAIAAATGYSNSAIATATYTIAPPAATPSFSPAGGNYSTAQTVTIADATSGVTIYYTTNGTTPTTSSTVYSGPITVSSSATVSAIASGNGYSSSQVGSATYTISSTAATPVFSPVAGTYMSAQTVTITDATNGAAIYYTINGTTPSASSNLYSGPITVGITETVKAIAIATGYANSAVASATYTLKVATPVFTPAAGTYSAAQSVTITDATPGVSIYYTTDGTTPTTSSTLYSGPITVSVSETLKALAVETGYSASSVASAVYKLMPATPVLSPVAGTYMTPQTVTITDATNGASIYYTLNGTMPSASSTLYSGPITVGITETLEAIAIETGYTNSAVAGATYTLHAATPVFTPAAGTYSSAQSVTITDATPGVSIYYTTDGSTPTTSSTQYSGAITVSANETLKAMAAETGYTASLAAVAAYKFVSATPVFSPPAGSYVGAQSVTITDATSGAAIYYTVNGTTPSASSTRYTGPITVATTEAVNAIAIMAGYANSAVASAAYTIQGQAKAPLFTQAAGTYTGAQTITISDATTGATIYYTTNGSTPTTSSTVYNGPITVASTGTMKAIATAFGLTNSPVTTAAYTIH